MLLAISAIIGAISLTDWGSIWAIIAGVVALGLVIWQVVKAIEKNRNIQRIYVCYLKPKDKYPDATFVGAPEQEQFPRKLTVTTDSIYTLFIQIHPLIDIIVDPVLVSFLGTDMNKPRIEGRDNPFIREKLEDGASRDWWGDIHKPAGGYPRPVYSGDCLMDTNKIHTFGQWKGEILVQIPIREIGKIKRTLGFTVSTSINDDEIPYLRNLNTNTVVITDSTTNIGRY